MPARLPPPTPTQTLANAARQAGAAVVFLLPYDDTRHADDAARTAPRLTAPVALSDIDIRPRPTPVESGWVHQAFAPLPTDGFLAMRAATAAYRKGP